jgi:hypothetical protein
MQTGSVVTEQQGEHFIHLTFGTETVSFERTLRNERHLAQFMLVFVHYVTNYIDHLKYINVHSSKPNESHNR